MPSNKGVRKSRFPETMQAVRESVEFKARSWRPPMRISVEVDLFMARAWQSNKIKSFHSVVEDPSDVRHDWGRRAVSGRRRRRRPGGGGSVGKDDA